MNIVLICYLIITLIASLYIAKNDIINISNDTSSKNIVLFLITLLDIFFTLMLFKWKKWALYGLGMTTFVTFIYNLSEGMDFLVSVIGLSGFLIILGLLFLKKNGKSGYENLE
ncbi:hypothetical protein [Chryseobacterium sp.]|uniref:hypothetical protein n=1 Tax=Chryseobacterium sp. TaxID=1871047 RepID=UPI0011C8A305|nr:hypothetical protein [Chryseobacterium sp.]TXF76349.1 hypothetical protein FUA25_10725 [Chryseobacterium sp.]